MQKQDLIQDQLLNIKEVAAILRVTTRTVIKYKELGLIKYYQKGRVLRFRKSDVISHIENNLITKK